MISIGVALLGGPEQDGAEIGRALSAAQRIVVALYGQPVWGQQAWATHIFVVPGRFGRPDFDGLVIGQYSRKHNALSVKIAVPDTVVAGTDIDNFIVASLHRANRMAYALFTDKCANFDLEGAEYAVLQVGEHLSLSRRDDTCFAGGTDGVSSSKAMAEGLGTEIQPEARDRESGASHVRVTHFLRLPSEVAAERLATTLQNLGYVVEVDEGEDAWTLQADHDRAPFDADAQITAGEELERLALAEGGEYLGREWETAETAARRIAREQAAAGDD